MKQAFVVVSLSILLLCSLLGQAQQTVATTINAAVPPLVNFSGTLTDNNGKPLTSSVAVTFSIYSEQRGGTSLWMESQSVQPDRNGHYTVMLGSTSSTGLPANIFVEGEARWLGVQVQGEDSEQPRVLLVSAPYALKAGDAQTLGGLPASAFVLAAPVSSAAVAGSSDAAANIASAAPPPSTSDVTTTGGTVNTLPLFSTATNIQNSLITQTGTSAISIGGKLGLFATGTATPSGGKDSQPQDFVASSYNSSSKAAVAQTFQFQAEPAENDTSTPSGTLNLLYGSGTAAPAETGLKIASDGLITFAAGQTFPGTGDGTITEVTAGADLTGGGSSGAVTLNLDIAKVPLLASANTFTANQTVNGTVTATSFSGNGSALTNITASNANELGGLAASAYAQLGAVNTFTQQQNINAKEIMAASSSYDVLDVTNSAGSGDGIHGTATSSTSYGVEGISPNVGVFGSSTGTNSGIGMDGHGYVGVKGLATGTSFDSYGILGLASQAVGGYFSNDSGFLTGPTLSLNNSNTSNTSTILDASSSAGSCTISSTGNLTCTGSISGAAEVENGARKVLLTAVQSPDSWFEDAGSGQLSNGTAHVVLDPTYAQTANTGLEYHVFLTPNGDCKGLYVSQKSADSFEVRELGGGASTIAFDYRIMAKRAGHENQRLQDVTELYRQMEKQRQMRLDQLKQHSGDERATVVSNSAVPMARK